MACLLSNGRPLVRHLIALRFRPIRFSSTSTPNVPVNSAPVVTAPNVTNKQLVTDDSIAPKITADSEILKNFVVPEPPLPPELLPLAPVTLKTFNFSVWFPAGWIGAMLLSLESFMPYYAAIISATVVGRIILTPVMIQSSRQSAKTALLSPKISEIMAQRKQAELRGDKQGVLKWTYKLAEVYKNTDTFKMRKMVVAPFCSMAVFGSFFIALRRMVAVGHEPLKEGGFATFVDLTIPDTSYILPACTALSLYSIMKIGVEYGSITSVTSQSTASDLLKKGSVFVIPAVIFYATCKMPAAVGLYWATSNFISIGQSLVMLRPSIRKKLGIPPTIPKVKTKSKGILGGVKDTWFDIKKSWKSNMEDRAARKVVNEYNNEFDRSGVGPLRKTFDYDPTKLHVKSK